MISYNYWKFISDHLLSIKYSIWIYTLIDKNVPYAQLRALIPSQTVDVRRLGDLKPHEKEYIVWENKSELDLKKKRTQVI